MQAAGLAAPSAIGRAAESGAASRAPPDVTTLGHWSGACVVATGWVVLVLHAAGRGLG